MSRENEDFHGKFLNFTHKYLHVNMCGPPRVSEVTLEASCSLMSGHTPVQIERKPKRKSKLKIVEEIHHMPKRCLLQHFFKKKIVVLSTWDPVYQKYSAALKKHVWLDYCHQFPLKLPKRQFRKKFVRLFIPAAPLSFYSSIEPEDFEFMSMNGKHAAIPQCKNEFKWNGRSVKELAGSGSIYIRLIKDCAHSHSDDDFLPSGQCAVSNGFDNSQECNESLLHTVMNSSNFM